MSVAASLSVTTRDEAGAQLRLSWRAAVDAGREIFSNGGEATGERVVGDRSTILCTYAGDWLVTTEVAFVSRAPQSGRSGVDSD